MINNKFEVYKIQRELKRSGQSYTFKRKIENEYGEKTGDDEDVVTTDCLYHEQTSNVQLVVPDGAITRTKKIPMLLCLTNEDVLGLQVDDYTTINGKTYRVTGVLDVMNWGKISDISLEVVDDGRNPI